MAGVVGFEQNQSGQQPLKPDGSSRAVGVWGDSDTDIGVFGTSGVIPVGEVDAPTRVPAGVYGHSWTDPQDQFFRPISSAAVFGEGMNDTDVGVVGIGFRSIGVLALGADTPAVGLGSTFQAKGAVCQAYDGVLAVGIGDPVGDRPPAGVVAISASGGDGVLGQSADGNGVHGRTIRGSAVLGDVQESTVGPAAIGVKGVSPQGSGVFGQSRDNDGTVGLTVGPGSGVVGVSGTGDGVSGGSFFRGDGVSGFSFGGAGVRGGSRFGLAGLFEGDVRITRALTVLGSIFKSGGGFEIDHPLDPENKLLRHSFVESPDMLNVYSGTVTTDAEGEVVVELPGYFEALNKDFRYQLTVIGQFAKAIVSQEIRDSRFTIATDPPKVKVSWQVTGVRRDQWADANRIEVEKAKQDSDKTRHSNSPGPTDQAGQRGKNDDAEAHDPSEGNDRISPIVAKFPEPVQDQLRDLLQSERWNTTEMENVLARTRETLFPRPDRPTLAEELRQIDEQIARLRAQFRGGAEAT